MRVPSEFTTAAEILAYQTGFNNGSGLACQLVPQVGETYLVDATGRTLAQPDNVQELHRDICHEAELQARDFSPFELIAKEFNEEEDPDAVWAAYEAGVADAIFADVSTYTLINYGVSPEE